ncbi:BCCT family transporter, partial [Corynebacterium casei]|uniref:BCCT family transporter n=1 Tax=Corynebacterium casei TaxID=160386 RepID=UPI003FD333AB
DPLVMGTMSSRGNPAPNRLVVVFWGLCMVGIAIVMLLAGGSTTLTALQNLTILIALPFSVVLIFMTIGFIKDLHTDPAAIRRNYASNAVRNAVVRGLEEHGDDFEFSVSPAPEGRGAGSKFDSQSEELTEWYQRTDEDGNEIDFDYETGKWGDQDDPEENRQVGEDSAPRS